MLKLLLKPVHGTPWLLLVCAWSVVALTVMHNNPNFQWTDLERDAPYGGDFVQEWTGADILNSSSAGQLYDLGYFGSWQHDPLRLGFRWSENQYYPPVYPPVYYWLLKPLAMLSFHTAAEVWFTILLLSYIGAVCLTERFAAPLAVSCPLVAPERKSDGRPISSDVLPVQAAAFWMAMLLLPAMLSSWVMAQKGTIWLLVATISWILWQRDRKVSAGFVVALLSIKPTLFVCLPLFMLWKRQGWFLVGLTLGTAALWLTAACTLPQSIWYDYLKFVAEAGSYQLNSGYQMTWSCSLVSLFEFGHVGSFPTLKTILWLILAGFVLGSLREIRSEQLKSSETLFRLMMATCLLSPHWYYYDLVWLVLPLRMMLATAPKRAIAYTVVLWLGMTSAQLLGNHVQFPILALVCFGVLMHSRVVSRRKRKETNKHMELVERASELNALKPQLATR
ncbi:MAG: glycosyltransferase family 87 protein [Pirellulales bacterium]